MRTFAVINVNDSARIAENIAEKLPEGSKLTVFQRKSLENPENQKKILEKCGKTEISFEYYPDELQFHWSKLKNFVTKSFLDRKIGGFLHVIEDEVEIFADTKPFLDEIERMMKVFRLKSWLNTSCDGCNFIYAKYNPRLWIKVDEEEAMKLYDKTIAWCSNANTAWICYDLDTAQFEDVRFEERFDFPMYFIIEFLARRRNTKRQGELCYMNYYPSVPEEMDVFRFSPV